MLFDIGSIGKNFVAVLVLQLVEEERLGLDDPIRKWLPVYPHIDGTITIRQLLNHTSGVFDFVDFDVKTSINPQKYYRVLQE